MILPPGRPEEYVDRDRVISVNIGPQDIRTSMLKQRMFLSKTHVFMQVCCCCCCCSPRAFVTVVVIVFRKNNKAIRCS